MYIRLSWKQLSTLSPVSQCTSRCPESNCLHCNLYHCVCHIVLKATVYTVTCITMYITLSWKELSTLSPVSLWTSCCPESNCLHCHLYRCVRHVVLKATVYTVTCITLLCQIVLKVTVYTVTCITVYVTLSSKPLSTLSGHVVLQASVYTLICVTMYVMFSCKRLSTLSPVSPCTSHCPANNCIHCQLYHCVCHVVLQATVYTVTYITVYVTLSWKQLSICHLYLTLS